MRFFTILLFLATVSLPAQDAAPKQGGGRGPQPPKNLKILKPEEIRTTMGNFRIAMGQQCTFCHVAMNDFASDENPKKEIARHMLLMVNEINAKFTDGKVHVSCYTCHRGKTIPDMAPPPAAPAPQQ
jgi:Photosynthetic reaction centre cytochrome C subunit